MSLWGTEVDWSFGTSRAAGHGRPQLVINQGKVLGGSTSVNAMMYVRGNRCNYRHVERPGRRRLELPGRASLSSRRWRTTQGGASEYHGVGGPIPVVDCPDPVMVSNEFMVGATEVGYDGPHWDTNGARQENGAGLLQFHISPDGKRASAATVFLTPIMDRPNLTVETGARGARDSFRGQAGRRCRVPPGRRS